MSPSRARFASSRKQRVEFLLVVFVAAFTSRRTSAVSAAARIKSSPSDKRGREGATSVGGGGASQSKRWCRVGELLPRVTIEDRSPEWSAEDAVEHPYGCDCASMKSRYFCPSLHNGSYPEWVPHAVAEGKCKGVTRSEMQSARAPLPPDFKVLFYGNSHMRQVVESIMCLFQGAIAKKRGSCFSASSASSSSSGAIAGAGSDRLDKDSFYSLEDVLLSGDEQCRACFDEKRPHAVTSYQRALEDNACIPGNEACRCNDDYGEFLFENGAVVDFYFANDQPEKSVSDALEVHGGVSFSHYDAVFANLGNKPRMHISSALDAAVEVQAENVQFFWLSTYEGYGDLSRNWDERQRKRFRESGARFVGIDRMVRGLQRFTKGAVEDTSDHHFCLPGPPNEIGLLLLKMSWAVHQHKGER